MGMGGRSMGAPGSWQLYKLFICLEIMHYQMNSHNCFLYSEINFNHLQSFMKIILLVMEQP